MRRQLIAGNWKMHGSRDSVAVLLQELQDGLNSVNGVELAVFPPSVFLAEAQHLLKYSPIAWGAQNLSDKPRGALTGEISANMLVDYGCQYVIIGHSERRTLFHEDNRLVAEKFVSAQQAGLKPILCVGETAAQREQGKTLDVVQQQLAAVLDLVDNLDMLTDAVIAYEPVWAIGTGQVATPDEAQQVHAAIRAQLVKAAPQLAEKIRIVYGGSVKPENAAELFKQPDIDGGLVGGASLDAKQFLEIAKQCHN